MTTDHLPVAAAPARRPAAPSASLRARLRHLQVLTVAGNLVAWWSVEKLLMVEIGFTPALIGLVAAAYAVVVPPLEVASGVLADRWSRRGVLALAFLALAVSSLVGGLSRDVAGYVGCAVLFGVFAALFSGTGDAIVYDLLVEENGSGAGYEAEAGRLRVLASIALVTGALAGSLLAAVGSPRWAYLATVPVMLVALATAARLPEPRLHRQDRPVTLRRQLTATVAVLTGRALRAGIACLVLTGALGMVIGEFNQLWLVEDAAPELAYGPVMAGLFLADGLGGAAAGWTGSGRGARRVVPPVAVVLVAATTLLVLGAPLVVEVAALLSLVVAVSWIQVVVTRQIHDATPSALRTGVISAVSGLSSVVFLPAAVGFGVAAERGGVSAASGMFVPLVLLGGVAALGLALRSPRPGAADGRSSRFGPAPAAPVPVLGAPVTPTPATGDARMVGTEKSAVGPSGSTQIEVDGGG